MEVKTKVEDRTLTIALQGDLDHHAARGLMEQADRLMEQNLPSKTILDLGGLTFMDSSGIAGDGGIGPICETHLGGVPWKCIIT